MPHSNKYDGPNPGRKDRCHCDPEPMFSKDDEKLGMQRDYERKVYCLRCGLEITAETIIAAVARRRHRQQ